MNVGFVGYSDDKFDKEHAKEIIDDIFKELNSNDVIISGATNMGIPKLVYEKAKSLNMKTEGIIPEEGKEYEMFPVDEIIFEGKQFGDESLKFLSTIDILYKIGGGKQSTNEAELAKKMNIEVNECDLKISRLARKRKDV